MNRIILCTMDSLVRHHVKCCFVHCYLSINNFVCDNNENNNGARSRSQKIEMRPLNESTQGSLCSVSLGQLESRGDYSCTCQDGIFLFSVFV